jgi:hypothetical protein
MPSLLHTQTAMSLRYPPVSTSGEQLLGNWTILFVALCCAALSGRII